MTKENLINFINDNKIEWDVIIYKYKVYELIIFPSFTDMGLFCEMLKEFFKIEAVKAFVKDGYLEIILNDLLLYHSIDIEEVVKELNKHN